jgi:hypothetical protein
MIRRAAVLLVLLATTGAARDASGQLATVRGRVVEAETGAALPGATVRLSDSNGTERGVSAGRDGRFELRRLPPGTYVLGVSFVGYEPRLDTLQVGFGAIVDVVVRLETSQKQLEEIVVEEDRRDAAVGAGVSSIRPAALARVPMPDVTYDLAGYLLTLPGFVSTGDRGGQLFVRGGTPTQNLVLIDGIPIFQPFHIVGFYSAFPADIVSWADVYAGGFTARYGGRISAVVDITTRNGDKRRLRAAGSIAPFLASVRAEIPVARDQVSLVASWRESVIDRIAPDLLGRGLPFRFGDRYAKLHAYLSPTSSFSFTILNTFDEGALDVSGNGGSAAGESPAEWGNTAFGSRYTYMPSEAPVVAQFSMYYTRLVSRYRPLARRPQESDVRALTMAVDFVYLLGRVRLQSGVFGNLHLFVYDLGNRFGGVRTGVTSGGVFVDARFDVDSRLRLEPGLRMESFSQEIGTAIDPRLRVTFLTLGGRQQWTLAYGRYRQQIVGVNNEQDVSDVFSVWAPSPRATPVPQAVHYLAGVNSRVLPWLELSLEGYLKDFSNLAFPVFNREPQPSGSFSLVEGNARGMDVRAEVNRPSFHFSTSYSLSDVTYRWSGLSGGGHLIEGLTTVPAPDDQPFDPPHDRTHQVNAMVQVSRGPWRASVRWQYGTGLPFTRINGFYDGVRVTPDPAQPHLVEPGELLVSRGATLDSRFPAYHRLDLSVERDFRFRVATATLQAGLMNAYDRANLFEYNYVTGERIDQLPLVPSVGLNIEVH